MKKFEIFFPNVYYVKKHCVTISLLSFFVFILGPRITIAKMCIQKKAGKRINCSQIRCFTKTSAYLITKSRRRSSTRFQSHALPSTNIIATILRFVSLNDYSWRRKGTKKGEKNTQMVTVRPQHLLNGEKKIILPPSQPVPPIIIYPFN